MSSVAADPLRGFDRGRRHVYALQLRRRANSLGDFMQTYIRRRSSVVRGPAVCLLLLFAFAARARPQEATIVPDLTPSGTTVRLRLVATNLPVEQEFVTPVFTQRVGPTDLTSIPGQAGGRVITTYGGSVYYLDAAGQLAETLFLDLRRSDSPSYSEDFEFGGAHGLTSIAFHPRFDDPTSPGYLRFYTLEAERSMAGIPDFDDDLAPGEHHQEALYEYQLDTVDATHCSSNCAASKREVFRVNQPSWHHNLGDLLFHNDESLLVTSADSGVASSIPPIRSDHALDLATVYGKILRIDPLGNDSANGQYGIPANNPFVDGVGGNVDEIFAYGLRNPYRIDINRNTGQLYAIETGERNIESIEAIESGKNYGWNEKEGSWIYDKVTKEVSLDADLDGNGIGDLADERGYTEPLFEYGRQNGIAVTGVAPVTSPLLPELDGQILFSDFEGALFFGDSDTGEAFQLGVDTSNGRQRPYRIHSVNRDAAGNVYLLGIHRFDGGDFDGVVYRVESLPASDGDVDGNGKVDVDDVDQLATWLREGVQQSRIDLNDDGWVSASDHVFWVESIRNTYVGDANLDGEFSSRDLVYIFQANEYEDGIVQNSTWASGDWNGDGDFTTADLVRAFQSGGYGMGPRSAIVPEPQHASSVVAWVSCAIAWCGRRKQRARLE